MTMTLKIFSGLYALLMAMFGIRWLFAFDGIAAEWLVQPLTNHGVNNLMADMGSLFLGSAIMIALGLRQGHSVWLLATAVLMIIAATGRVVGYATVGYVPATLVPLLFEVFSSILLVATHYRVTKSAQLAQA